MNDYYKTTFDLWKPPSCFSATPAAFYIKTLISLCDVAVTHCLYSAPCRPHLATTWPT